MLASVVCTLWYEMGGFLNCYTPRGDTFLYLSVKQEIEFKFCVFLFMYNWLSSEFHMLGPLCIMLCDACKVRRI